MLFTDLDTAARDVIHNFKRDGFEAPYPRYNGGRPRTFTLPKRQEIKRIALSEPQDLGQPFATCSAGLFLSRPAGVFDSDQPISPVLAVLSPGTVTIGVLVVAGCCCSPASDDGVYVLVACEIAAMSGGVTRAWLLLTRIGTQLSR